MNHKNVSEQKKETLSRERKKGKRCFLNVNIFTFLNFAHMTHT